MINEAIYAIKAAKEIYNSAKLVVEIMEKQKDLGKEFEILELRQLVLQISENALICKKENLDLYEENQTLRDAAKVKTETYFDKGVFWGKDGSGPYCPTCFQGSNLLAYLTPNDVIEKDCWICTKCNKPHITPEANQRMADRARDERFKKLASGFTPRVTNSFR